MFSFVDRRLLPVIVLLAIGIAAVPMLLKRDPAAPPAAATPPAGDSASADLSTQAVVQPAGAGDRSGRRVVLGRAKDPFRPTGPKAKQAKTGATGVTGASGVAKPGVTGKAPVNTNVTTGFDRQPTTPSTTEKQSAAAAKYEVDVRIRRAGGDWKTKRRVPRLTPLPNNDFPVLVYLGLLDDEKTAVFLVSSDVKVVTDGKCRPSNALCERVHLVEGESMLFERLVNGKPVQYELELVRIRALDAKALAARAAAHKRKLQSSRSHARAKLVRADKLRRQSIRFGKWLVKVQKDRLDGLRFRDGFVRYPARTR